MTTGYFHPRKLKFAGFLLIMLFGLSMSAQITRYVKQGGNGNGYSWETASGSLQSMIDQADSGWQIYVSAGTYQQGTGQSFSMKSGVKIYGGFPATGSPDMADRNPALNPTILQGNGNRVLMNTNVDTAARLDGFTIQGGVTSGAESGAGIYNFSSSPKIVGCIIRNNTSGNWGGGIYSHYGYATFTNCLIYGNTAGGGGAAFEHEAQSTYTNCTITANTSLQNGGAMHTHENGTLTITNSIVWDNNAAAQGDELYTTGSSTIVLIFSIAANEPGDTFGNITPSGNTSYANPMFADAANNNFAPVYGSPAVNTGNSSYINGYSTDLAGNTRISLGTVDKGAYEFQATIRYVKQNGTGNGFSWNDASGDLQAMINASESKVWVAAGTYTPATGASFTMKEGIKIYGGFPTTGNPGLGERNFAANVTILQGNGTRVVNNDNNGLSNAAVLDGFTITGGNAPNYGGGLSNVDVSPLIANCIFRNNSALYGGGGISNDGDYCAPTVKNCLFYSNTSQHGGATYDFDSKTNYINATISGNYATSDGGGMVTLWNANITVNNSILWGNSAGVTGHQASFTGAIEVLRNTIVNNGYQHMYGNFTAINVGINDPMFVDAANFNFRLKGTSPARQAGDTAQFPDAANSFDLDNNARLIGGVIDIGAYEKAAPVYGNTLYVKQGATGEGTGWDDPSPSLQAMIDAATSGKQVWVAAGTYTPASGQSFSMKQGVAIYGGFPATGSPGMAERNYKTNVTILSGNGSRVINNTNNGLTNLAILDGFTIRDGNVTGNGAGMNNVNSYPLVANCIFQTNTATNWGGAVYNEGAGSSRFVNCLFYNCSANGGGAVFENSFSATNYRNCTFSKNNSTGNGGAIHTYQGGIAYLYSSIVWGNTCTGSGKQLYSVSQGQVIGSYADVAAGANDITGYYYGDNSLSSNPLFTAAGLNNFTLTAASPARDTGYSSHAGGYTSDLAGNPRISGFSADMGVFEFQSSAPVIRYVRQGGTGNGSSWTQASGNLYYMVLQTQAGQSIWIAEGTYGVAGGLTIDKDISIYGGFPATGSPVMADRNWGIYKTIIDGGGSQVINYIDTQNSVLDGMTITGGGSAFGGGVLNTNASPRIDHCIFRDNTTSTMGGAIYNSNSSPVITNTLFYNNISVRGGAMYNQGSSHPQLVNITFTGNHAWQRGGAIYNDSSAVATLKNSIIWGNTADNSGYQMYSADTYITAVNCILLTDIYNVGSFFAGENNISSDPLFSGDNDYSLVPCSPAMNAGSTALLADAATAKDLAGNARTFGAIDIGAFEIQSSAVIAAPTATTPQQYDDGATVADLDATGTALQWYTASEDGGALDPATALNSGTYYVSQTVGGCESARTAVVVTLEALIIPIRHVKTVAAGNGSGSSWDNASGDLQGMIDAASPGDQVWVAAGTYQPAAGQSFRMKEGVQIYGGFPANENPGINDRDLLSNPTILSGNGSRVFDNFNITPASRLDGFVISNGSGVQNGAGMQNVSSSPVIANCIFRQNTAGEWGGGMYNFSSSPTVINSLFYDNHASGGGASFDHYFSHAKFINVTFTGNFAGNGGAVHTYDNTETYLDNCIIWNNDAQNGGDQVYSLNSDIVARNCLVEISGNNIVGTFLDSGTISGDPLFEDANAGDYRLKPCSIAINAGDASLFANAETATDLSGNSRSYGNGIDLGPFEYQAEALSVPVAASPQVITEGSTISALEATGTGITWYDSANSVTPISPDAVLVSGTYYVAQTVSTCESQRTAVVVTVTGVPSSVRYVRPWASGTGDGSSWSNASNDIQLMINELPEGQIWVAAGSYQRGWTSSFSMKTGVSIYGGFPTDGSPGMADRDLIAYETTLVGNNASVVTAVGVSNALLDGFTITGGLSNGDGGGIIAYYSAMSFENLIVKNNSASKGGGIMLEGGASSLKNISLLQNLASFYGGGIGIANSTGVNYLENMIIQDNESYYFGGGLAPNENANVVVKNALITGNTAQLGGGLAVYPSLSTRFTNITVSNNTAYIGTAAYLQNSGSTTIQNSILSGDILVYNSQVNTSNSIIYGSINGNMATNGGNVYAEPQFANPSSGNYSLQAGSPGVDAGDTSLFEDAGTATDLAGSQRVYGSGIDMGAYELKPDCGTIATSWNGVQWSDGAPVSYEYSATINGNFNSAEDGAITACSLTVYVGDVIIADGDNFTIKGAVTVDNNSATFTVQHNANLIQIDDVENIGTIHVIKESAPMYRLDYALWASPVAGQKLKAFSTQTLDNRFYTYNPLSDAYATVQAPATTDFGEGRSYLIRVANNHPAYVNDAIAPIPWEGTFIGVPNNGNVSVPVTGMADGINGYNGVGNPYPSSINIKAFFEANQNNLAEDSPIYFWRKKNDANTSSYCSLTLAGYNQNSGNAFGDSSNGVFDDPNNSENWVINPGQGFIVQATVSTVTFNNEMRVAVNNGQMFRSAMDASDKSRLWLNLTNSNGAFGQATIAYTPFTTLGRDFGWDGKALADGDIAIYSLAGENKFGIQARPAFDPADEVPMEYKITTAGNYTISLDHFDGVFAEGQEIYLRDNVLGVTHNLNNPYEFTTETGIITGRFDVVYAEALSTDIPTFNSNSIIVYKQGSAINISTGNVDMKSVAVYDIRGRLLYSADNINATATSITTLQAQEQMLIVEVITVEGVKAGRKIVF